MGGNEKILLDARLRSMIKDGVFRAELANGHELVAYSRGGGDARIGDLVRVQMSPYDMSKGLILDRRESRGDLYEGCYY